MFVPKCRRRNKKLFHSALIRLIGNSLLSAVIAENNFLLPPFLLHPFFRTTLDLQNLATAKYRNFRSNNFPARFQKEELLALDNFV